MDKLVDNLCTIYFKILVNFQTLTLAQITSIQWIHNNLLQTWGKHEITPMARQAADLTEGVSSYSAAYIYKGYIVIIHNLT